MTWGIVDVSYRIHINTDPAAIDRAIWIYNDWLKHEFDSDVDLTERSEFILDDEWDWTEYATWAEKVTREFDDSGEIDRLSEFTEYIHIGPPNMDWTEPPA